MAGKSGICLKVRNPLTEDLDVMRTDLFPNLLQVIARNQSYGTNDVSVFEVGKVYFKTLSVDHGERLSIAGAMIGNMAASAWSLPVEASQVDFYTCKAVVENLLGGLGIKGAEYKAALIPMLHATRAAKIIIAGNEAGILGEVAPDVRESFDLRGRPYIFELDFQVLMAAAPKIIKYKEPARFPALYRHLAVVVDDEVAYTKLERLVHGSGKSLVADVDLLDVYKGEQIGLGRRSLTVSIVFRSQEKTLTDDEVNAVLADIKEALKGELGASFR
jgi:phenylalanyl-tRNA synthetase beta chain